MPKTITLPESYFVDTYTQAQDIQELVKLLQHHTFLEMHQGDGQILPGQLTLLENINVQLEMLTNDLDHNAFPKEGGGNA
ncbi:hypothetical protein [Maridesulfovibrio sp.]|uniref:hypothetical protein n=1 Tax=Maridesulfovibrio sp. TaxID=2795000 RepID=UPI0029F578EA|nr:hypothetical protein [Maridesulfovibrio sp.]